MYSYNTFVMLIPGLVIFYAYRYIYICIPMFLLMCVSFYIASHILGTKNRRKLGLTNKAGHKKGDYFGKGYATRLCVDLATASGMMDNADCCTAHGRRKRMISSLVNSSVALPMKIILDKSRHGLAEINARYQLPSKEMQHQARIAVFEKFDDAKEQLGTMNLSLAPTSRTIKKALAFFRFCSSYEFKIRGAPTCFWKD